MKRIIFIVALLFCSLAVSISAIAQEWLSIAGKQRGETVTKKILRDDASSYEVCMTINGLLDNIVTREDKEYHSLSLGEGTLQQVGAPALPIISELVAIPEGCQASVSVIEKKWKDISINQIFPFQQRKQGINTPSVFQIDGNAYSVSFIPSILETDEEQIFQNVKNVGVHICPFKYHPTIDKLSILFEFTLRVDFTTQDGQNGVKVSLQEGNDKNGVFDNKVYFREGLRSKSNDSQYDSYDYLIIVGHNPVILNSQELKNFRIWKALKGFKTNVVSTSDIGMNIGDIKQYIATEYTKGVRYVLLVGDENSIPVGHIPSFYFPATYIDSDYWYGCMNGSGDWQADVAIGRFSTTSAWDFRTMAYKTIRYESTPPLTDSVLLVAHKLAPFDYFGYQQCSQNIKFYPYSEPVLFTTSYGADEIYYGDNATNASVIQKINQGVPLVNYRGYGYPSYWGGEDGDDPNIGWNASGELFSYSEVNNMDSTSNAVFFSVSANTGDILATNNMLEAFTRSTYGAVAFLGSTANQYPEANHFYDMWLFAKLFDEEIYKLGDLNISAHIDNINTYYHGMFKDNAFSYICGGDPALELWTAPPQSFGNVELNESNGTIIITTECNGYYSVCISDEDGELLNTMYVNGNICSFNKPSGNFYIGINKHNYIPHVIYYNTDAETIQNVTFTFDGYYHHTPLAIGYGVSSDPAGNVTVKSGSKLIIENGAGGVYIDYGFKCEKGAVLDIK